MVAKRSTKTIRRGKKIKDLAAKSTAARQGKEVKGGMAGGGSRARSVAGMSSGD